LSVRQITQVASKNAGKSNESQSTENSIAGHLGRFETWQLGQFFFCRCKKGVSILEVLQQEILFQTMAQRPGSELAMLCFSMKEDKQYAKNLMASGIDCALDVVAGGPHAFEGLAPEAKVSKDYMARAKGWLASAIQIPPR